MLGTNIFNEYRGLIGHLLDEYNKEGYLMALPDRCGSKEPVCLKKKQYKIMWKQSKGARKITRMFRH